MKSDKNNISIRQGEPADRAALYRLWQACFHDSDAFTDYYFDYWFKENQVLLLEDARELKAMLHLNPYSLMAGGRRIESWYIVGVATDEAYRHRGAMRRLLITVFEKAYAGRLPFVYLMPADEAIYRPFEFAYIYGQQVEKKLPRPVLTNHAEGLMNSAISCHPALSASDLDMVAHMANDHLQRFYDLYTLRDSHYFDRLQQENLADGGELLMLYAEDRLIGYLSYAREQKIEIRELCCEREWRSEVTDWLTAYFGDAEGELLPLDPNGFLSAGGYSGLFVRPIIMGRIIDLRRWMALMPVRDESFSIILKITDRFIDANCGIWRWHVREGHTVFEKADRDPDISLSIDALMQWLTGYRSFDALEAAACMKINTDCRNILRQIPVFRGLFINEIV